VLLGLSLMLLNARRLSASALKGDGAGQFGRGEQRQFGQGNSRMFHFFCLNEDPGTWMVK